MVKVKDIVKAIEAFAPLKLAYEWDNSGLIVGDREKEVKKVYITLDMFRFNIDEAVASGADMVISHHPILFGGVKKLDYATQEGYVLSQLIKNDIALYAAHTSLDCTKGGINDVLAQKIGLCDTEIIEQSEKEGCGLGRVGNLKDEITLGELAEITKSALKTPFVRACGDINKKIKRVAVGGGGCSDLIPQAQLMGADVMITADLKYHIAADSVDTGICVIDAGHYPTEVFAIEIFESLLKNTEVEIIKSTCKDVFNVI